MVAMPFARWLLGFFKWDYRLDVIMFVILVGC